MTSPVRTLLLCSSRDDGDLVQGSGGNWGDNGGRNRKKVEEIGIDFGGKLIKCTDDRFRN